MPDIVGNGDNLGDHIATRSFKQIKGSDVASGDSVTLQADGNTFDVTGTTTINHITSTNWVIGSVMILHFDGAVTLTNNAGGLSGAECNILLSGDVNYTTSTGDIITLLLHDATNWQEISRNSSGSVGNGSITNAKLAPNAVTTDKIADGTILNADINAGAGIDATKLTDGSVSNTELNYINTVTANVQNQLNLKSPIASPTFTGTLTIDNLTIDANKIESINAGGAIELAPKTTGVVTVIGNTNDGAIKLNCTANSHGQTIKSQPHSANATNTMLLPLGADSTLVSLVSADTLTNKILGSGTTVTLGSDASLDIYYRSSSGTLARLAKGSAGEALKINAANNGLEWGSAGGGATIVHTYTNTTNAAYLGTASSFGTVGVNDRDIYIKKIDANNEGVFAKIWKNGSATEVQIA